MKTNSIFADNYIELCDNVSGIVEGTGFMNVNDGDYFSALNKDFIEDGYYYFDEDFFVPKTLQMITGLLAQHGDITLDIYESEQTYMSDEKPVARIYAQLKYFDRSNDTYAAVGANVSEDMPRAAKYELHQLTKSLTNYLDYIFGDVLELAGCNFSVF